MTPGTTRRARRKGRVAIATAALVCTVAVACGTDDSPPAGDTTSADETAHTADTAPTGPTAPPPGSAYVALGDSFAAGAGVSPAAEGAPDGCAQSAVGLGHLVARDRGYSLTDVSCSGARTIDLYRAQKPGVAPQLDALSPDTALVTVMIGGNDEGIFGGTVAQCSSAARSAPDAPSPCRDLLGADALAPVDATIGPAVEQGLRDIRDRAPKAIVALVGYPWLVPASGACPQALPFPADDVAFLHDLQSALDDRLRAAADATGAVYVDMADRSVGHDACASREDRWVEPLFGARQFPPLHPNAAGQRALADAVLATVPE